MKTKKTTEKIKKKKSIVDPQSNSGITKLKKTKKVKKIKSNGPVLEALKKDVSEQEGSKKIMPLRQEVWNKYLKTFYEVEKLNRKQKEIMAFCTSKSLTPPKRKRRFVNFIRNCFVNQADFTDELIEELFDLVLKKYVDYKSGSYSIPSKNNNSSTESESSNKVSKNKKKKLLRATKVNAKTSNTENDKDEEPKFEKVKPKKKKRSKAPEMEVDDNDGD